MEKGKGSLATLIACILFCQLAGLISVEAIVPSIRYWYAGIVKPAFTPPAMLFAPVWIFLYLLMGFSLYLIVTQNKSDKKTKTALLAFGLQWILNAAWPIAFFYFQNIRAGLLVILALELALSATICFTWKINRKAAYLLIPYLLWVSFALVLNYSIWILNP